MFDFFQISLHQRKQLFFPFVCKATENFIDALNAFVKLFELSQKSKNKIILAMPREGVECNQT